MAEFHGTVELIAGITPKNGGDFALVGAHDVQVDDQGNRLDTEFSNLKSALNNNVSELKDCIQYGSIPIFDDLNTWSRGYINSSGNFVSNARNITPTEHPIEFSNDIIQVDCGSLVCGLSLFKYDADSQTFSRKVSEDRTGVFEISATDDITHYALAFKTDPLSTITPSVFDGAIRTYTEWIVSIEKNSDDIETLNQQIEPVLEIAEEVESIDQKLTSIIIEKSPDPSSKLSEATVTQGAIKLTNGSDASAGAWSYYTLDVTAGQTYTVTGYAGQSGRLWLVFEDDNPTPIDYSADASTASWKTETVTIENGTTLVLNTRNDQGMDDVDIVLVSATTEAYVNPEKIEIENKKIKDYIDDTVEESQNSRSVVAVKIGNDLQFRSGFNEKVMAISANTNGSQNGGFNLTNYYLLDSEPSNPHTIASGTLYKGAGDDITPIHYNGSYAGANHGKSPTWLITSNTHGLTEADIGTVWTSGANEYVIYRIDSENTFSLIGNTDGSYNDVVIATPVSPITSGANSISFSSAASQQMYPAFKNYVLSIKNNQGIELTEDEPLYGEAIHVCESYDIFDTKSIVEYLKANSPNNTNSSYFNGSIDSNMTICNTYTFEDSGMIVVTCNAIPTKQGAFVEYWGGIQSGRIGGYIYAPFTSYDSIQELSGTVNLSPATWDSIDFPAYKMYQFDDSNKGFAVGYVIDFGKGLPSWRKDKLTGANGAGFWYGSSKKMYPHFYDVPLGTDLYGDSLSFIAFRAPVLKTGNLAKIQYDVGKSLYIEIESFNQQLTTIPIGEKYNNRKISVIKKDADICLMTDVISNGNIVILGVGSMTLKAE